ncbi:co-chaperone GroES [Klebsiella pneumoniae]|uniref:co-chaperone GroES n=1 Tax=Klebsiella pneumoniae TaxID=573 RepID=UPI0034DCE123
MEEEKPSAGGIVIPDSATEKPIKGVSRRCRHRQGAGQTGYRVRAPQAASATRCCSASTAGTEVKLDGVELLVVKEDDLARDPRLIARRPAAITFIRTILRGNSQWPP